MNTPIIVTGAAGFIGFHVARRLLDRGTPVVGIDNLNDYYDPALKEARLALLSASPTFSFHRLDLAAREDTANLFAAVQPQVVIHLAAQAGVRYSLEHPETYIDANLVGFGNVLEGCRRNGVRHLVYASSSSVYGANTQMPFSVHDNVDHPVSLYAATKKANELMAHCYSHLYGLATTGLRFFTVYGPWGRPDMALFRFTRAILADEPIEVYNNGQMRRDFTYVDDVAEGVLRTADRFAAPNPEWSGDAPDPGSSSAPFRIYNIGNTEPVELLRMIEILEAALGKEAKKTWLPMQAGDVPATWADVDDLVRDTGYRPATPLKEGIESFVAWYREYYR
ncbi:NAD-dependent epimerase [Hyphomicrobium nitrativorans]|uniref:NAD-dependent epimerase n=1 Tax=Hyphomicrobium nitrativorans TaxID=1427356 RepID=UPI00059BC23A|nr:NAD-dependent epimerase [Hyphomicrobium nitrativorans]